MYNPLSFQAQFQSECLEGSAIAPDLYSATISFVEDSGRWETYAALNRQLRSQWQTRKPHDFGVLACFINEDGSLWQAKPEYPEISSDGKISKYIAPTGSGSRGFTPAVTVRVWSMVAKTNNLEHALPEWVQTAIAVRNLEEKSSKERSFWRWVEQFPQIEIVITEGGKKSLAALSQGYVTIALFGVNAGVSKYETIAGEKIRKAKPELITDIQRFIAPGRIFVLGFDHDAQAKTRYKVESAVADLSWHLEQTGCATQVATWDGQNGRCKGIDDLIAHAGADAWTRAYQEAIPANQWRIARHLSRQVRRSPDMSIGDREFSAVADLLPKSGLVVLYGGKGTGKSQAIGAMLKGRTWLSSTPLISLGRDQATAWNGVFINDGDLVGAQLLKEGVPVDGASVCVPSLLKVRRVQPDVLVLDETSTHLEFLLNSKLANQQGMRPLLIAEHQRQVQSAQLVILADADLTEETIAYYEHLTGQRAYLVRSDRQALRYQTLALDCAQNEAIALMLAQVAGLSTGKLLYINTDSKALAESLSRLLEQRGVKSLLITSSTSIGDTETEFLSSKGNLIPDLALQGIQAIISSPTIAQGFSIEQHTNRIDSVWGFYRGGSITAQAIAQSLDRVRSSDVPRYVCVSKHGSAYSKLSKANSVGVFLREFKQVSTAAARLVRHSLTPDTINTSNNIDWQSSNLNMLAALEVRRNQGMKALKDTVLALLRHEGKQVCTIKPNVLKTEAQTVGKSLKAAAQSLKQVHAEAVERAVNLTEETAQELANRAEHLSREQLLSLEKFYLSQFYRTQVSANLVLLDRAGAMRHEIRNLEQVLNAPLATEQTASSINQNPSSPQDWHKAAVKSWLFEHSDFSTLVKGITAGSIERLDPEVIEPICQFVRTHSREFQLVFGFFKLDKISNQQIIGQMLATLGIRTQRRGKGENAHYKIKKTELDALLVIVNQRGKEVAPLQEKIRDQRGVTSLETVSPPALPLAIVLTECQTLSESPILIQPPLLSANFLEMGETLLA